MAKQKFGASTYIGHSATGLPAPVFFDLHYPIMINKPPCALITGEPGSGKTFAGLALAAHSVVLGKKTIILDPKGDFISLKKLERLGYIPPVNVWSLFEDGDENKVSDQNAGMLDPLTLTQDRATNVALTLDIIDALVKEVTFKQHNALIPILQDQVEEKYPSLMNVMRILQRSQDDEIRSLGFALETPLGLPVAKLLVSNPRHTNRQPIFQDQAVVISLLGLTIPAMGKPKKDYTTDERTASCIMRLISHLALEIMSESKANQKTLVIDEAWIVVGTESGSSLINKVTLLGRSLNMATLLITQSPLHLAPKEEGDASIDTTVSTRFAFRSSSAKDNSVSRENMRLPEGESWEQLFEALGQGQCMLKDCRDNLAIVQITVSDEWEKAFKTTPAPKELE